MGRTMLAENFKARPPTGCLEMAAMSSTTAQPKYPMCIRAQLEVRALAALTDQHRISAGAGKIRTVGGLSATVVEGDVEQIPEPCPEEELSGHKLPNGAILLTLLFPNLPRFLSRMSFTVPALLKTTG